MNRTTIEYLDYTYNPIAMRCTPIATGCKNCWHIRMCNRLKENYYSFGHKIRDAYAGEGPPILVESRLNDPLKVKKPSVVGTQFMGDLWHKDVTLEQRDMIYSTISLCPQHTFIILTKRPENVMSWWLANNKNVWLGVSISTQEDADKLVPVLLQIPAAVRIVSVEPMLGPVDIDTRKMCPTSECFAPPPKIDWVIIGCESGPKRRPCKLEWIESLVKQCSKAGVPVFCKQAEINGKVVSMPKILGRTWDQLPDNKQVENGQALTCGCQGFYEVFGVHRPGCSRAF